MMLLRVKIKILHFWACELSEKYRDEWFRIVEINPSAEGGGRGIMEVNADEKSLDEIISFLEGHSIISKVDILSRDKDRVILMVMVDCIECMGKVLMCTDSFLKPPMEIKGGHIYANVVGTPPNLLEFSQKLSEIPGITAEVLKKVEMTDMDRAKMTQRQEDILHQAVSLGYYQLPRKITLENLAKKLDIAPSTLSEHLRKVEDKLVSAY